MKKITSLFVLWIAVLALSACNVNIQVGNNEVITGSGKVVTRQVEVSNFDAVLLSSIGDLTISQGDTESLTIEAEDNILAVLTQRVRGGQLELGAQPNTTITPTQPIRYTLVVKDLSKLELSGLGNASMDGLTAGRLELNISGSGNMDLSNLKADDVRVSIGGLGSVKLTGEASALMVALDGSGNFNGGSLSVKTSNVSISGLGSATVWANESLDVSISGAGNLEYYGSPKVSQNISGLGHVKNLGEK